MPGQNCTDPLCLGNWADEEVRCETCAHVGCDACIAWDEQTRSYRCDDCLAGDWLDAQARAREANLTQVALSSQHDTYRDPHQRREDGPTPARHARRR